MTTRKGASPEHPRKLDAVHVVLDVLDFIEERLNFVAFFLSSITSVLKLITDFASPYGVELLATVHWTATRDTAGKETDPATLTATIHACSSRKERLFTEHHVRVRIER